MEVIKVAIKTILTDLGNVILYFDMDRLKENLRKRSRLFPEEFDRRFDPFAYPYSDFSRGKMGKVKFYEEIQRKLGIDVSFGEFRELWCNIFTPNGRVIELWKSLRNKGHRIVLLSNLDELHYEWVNDYFRLEFLHHALYSFELGYIKPEEEIYGQAFPHCNCKKSEIVFVDDLKHNIVAARKYGFPAIQFSGDFNELCRELEKLGVKVSPCG